MQHYTGPIETLTDCERAGRNLMGECRCGHMRGFSPYTLRSDLRRDMTLADVAARMRCSRCRRIGTVRLAYNRNVVEIAMDRLRRHPQFRAMLGELPPAALLADHGEDSAPFNR